MPAGVTWGQYISFSVAAMVSMLMGSQVVHLYYKPLQDLNKYIDKELKNFPDNIQIKIKEELKEEGVLK
ncbi:ubiquinol-cytochrome-c reductase complex assembly factor 6 [Achroia grisella]|uniref:ubiquinol-cytochrome-c reductase complex assembly factor 6 n=1 Tax=Achroia grisella TaxID=688607 RepID=UPI0027D25742|nr:ubiquinol-cytochrome-c reductase complex assembly factor 6 [Achroia grisella]